MRKKPPPGGWRKRPQTPAGGRQRQRPHPPSAPASSPGPDRGSRPDRRAQRPPKIEGGDWLFGVHAVREALVNPKRRVRRLLATSAGAAHLPAALKLKPELVGPDEIGSHLPREAVHQGLAILTEPLPGLHLSEACAAGRDEPALVLALDQVTDPHNVGAILRTACAFGARALILTERHAPQAMGTLAKAASGALEHVPLVRIVNLARGLDELKELGYRVIGLDEAAPESLSEIERPTQTVIVLGAEGTGLRRLTRERCDIMVRLPTTGPIQSLNVSNAAAIALYALR